MSSSPGFLVRVFLYEPSMLITDRDKSPKMHCVKRNVLSSGSFAKKVKREIKLNTIPRILLPSFLFNRNNIAVRYLYQQAIVLRWYFWCVNVKTLPNWPAK